MKKTSLLLLVISIFCQSCIVGYYEIFVRSPGPKKFKLYGKYEQNIENKIKTSGIYCFQEKSEMLNKYYSSYYRFTARGEMRISNSTHSCDSIYHFEKEFIDKDWDKNLYGYFAISKDTVRMEYVYEDRQAGQNIFHESTGVLSKSGDTLYVKEHKRLKDGKTETLNRTCVFYSFN